MKTEYQKPDMFMVLIQHQTQLLQTSVNSNTNVEYGGGSDSSAHSRLFSDIEWEDDQKEQKQQPQQDEDWAEFVDK